MNEKIFITFDKSQEDIPVLIAFKENNSLEYLGERPSVTVLNTITGYDAVDTWNKLVKKGE